MTLQNLIESTHGESPGYADAANDCLVEVADGSLEKEDWLVASLVFATLAVAEELRRLITVGESIANSPRGLA